MRSRLAIGLLLAGICSHVAAAAGEQALMVLRCSMVNIETTANVPMSVLLDEKKGIANVNGMAFLHADFQPSRIAGALRRSLPSSPGVWIVTSFSLDRVTGRLSLSTYPDVDGPKATGAQVEAIERSKTEFPGFIGTCTKAERQF